MCRKTDALRGPLARRRASIDPRDTPLDVASKHGVCCKPSAHALEPRARGPKTRVVGRYIEPDRRQMDAGRRKRDPDSPKTGARVREDLIANAFMRLGDRESAMVTVTAGRGPVLSLQDATRVANAPVARMRTGALTIIAFAVLGPRAVEIDVPGSDCVAQAAEQVAQEQRLGVRRFRVPHVGVPRAPAIEIVVPAHGVMSAVRTALVARFIDLDEHVNGRIDRLEVVELVLATEASGQARCRYVRRVEDAVAARAYVGIAGMAVEVRAGQSAVPGPVVPSARGGGHADAAPTDTEYDWPWYGR